MNSDLLTIFLGFVEGFALIVSPCILPILPIFLAASLSGSKKRPLGIIIGFTLSFALFAYFYRLIALYTGVDLNHLRIASYVILFILGLVMLSEYLTEAFSRLTQTVADRGSRYLNSLHLQDGLLSGLIIGSLIAIIWTPCAGPILATVIVQTALQNTTITSFFVLVAFALGAGIPMLIIALYGRRLIHVFAFFKTQATLFRKILGVIIIASVGYMIYQEHSNSSLSTANTTIKTSVALENGLWRPYNAPEIAEIDSWFNSPRLRISDLQGKVVLIDFWTYSCINCVRTLPYIKDWYEKYHKQGLVIIGIHTPEFVFEKEVANVQDAIKRFGILYPVALDNQYRTWQNFDNHYWPAHYLINKEGKVVYEHFGEGDYAVTENNIRYLLGIDQAAVPSSFNSDKTAFTLTPETYLGYERADPTLAPNLVQNRPFIYSYNKEPGVNAWALQGSWQVNADKIIAIKPGAAIKIHFNARKIYVVMGNNSNKAIKVDLLLNGTPQGSIQVKGHMLYEVLQLPQMEEGVLQLTTDPGLEIYTFTFGG